MPGLEGRGLAERPRPWEEKAKNQDLVRALGHKFRSRGRRAARGLSSLGKGCREREAWTGLGRVETRVPGTKRSSSLSTTELRRSTATTPLSSGVKDLTPRL